MRKNIEKRIFAVVLAAVLMGNSLQLSADSIKVAAQEVKVEESEAAISGNDMEEGQLEEKDETVEDFTADEEPSTESDRSEAQEDSTIAKGIRIGQMADMDTLPYPDDPDCIYDMPVLLAKSSEVRLFAEWNAADGGTLAWSILRGEAGMIPGTTTLVDREDDWTEFEAVSSSSIFTIQEDVDENSVFYKTLTITTNDVEADDNYDYYIRATVQYGEEQTGYKAITTVPIIVEATAKDLAVVGTEEEPAAAEEESATAEETEEESATAEETEEESATAEGTEEEPAAAEGTENDLNAVFEQDSPIEEEESEIETEDISANELDASAETESKESETVIRISKLMLNKTSATMNPGDTLKPSVTIVPQGLDPVIIWSSSNSDVADVDTEGNISALAEGSAEITAECDGKTASIRINVVKTDAEKNNDQPKDEEGNVMAISDEVWVAGFERESDALIYTGGKITQNLRIYHKGTLLKEKTDYTLTYKNNVNAAAYNSSKAPSVTITMKGQYTGSRTFYFTILPREIDENNSLGYEQVIYYSKKLTIPAPTIYFGGKKLINKKDFLCDYSSLPENYTKGDSYEDGTSYEYTVNGIGNFTGSFTMKLSVMKDKTLDFGKAVITLDKKQYEYHGEALSASDVQIISVRLGKKSLDASLYEYSVHAEGVGSGYLEIYPSDAGRSAGYRGTKKVNIKVIGDRKIKDTKLGNDWQDTITFSQRQLKLNGGVRQEKTGVLYYGEEDDRESLTEGVDYTVKYSNHKKTGTATVTFTGIGRYSGSFKKTYKIVPNTDLELQWDDTGNDGIPVTAYMKNGAIPKFTLRECFDGEDSYVLSGKTDYTVTLKNNKKVGMMTCEIIGKGNYKGYRSITELKVIAGDISQGKLSVSDKQYSNKKNAWKSTVTITDVNGKKLTPGTDYDKVLIYNYEGMKEGLLPQAGTFVYITAVGINNYEGSSITGSYRIYSLNLSKLTVMIDAQEYTGKDIELSAEDIHVYANKSDAKKGIEITEPCYEIISYSNNVKVGTAQVKLRGVGDYGGTKTYSFKIKKKAYQTTRVTKVLLDETALSIGAENSRQLTATVVPEDAWNKTLIWTTSNSKIATVSPEGIVTAKRAGKATIKAVSQDTGKSASCKVSVSVIPVTSFVLNAEKVDQVEGTMYQLLATEIQPIGATYSTIKWESTNPEIASVDDNGLVSLNKAGMAVIKASTDQGQSVRKCLMLVSGREEAGLEGTYLTPQMFRSSDEDDDTAAFNKAINELSESCNTLYVPDGTYLIDAVTSIRLRSNMNFVMSANAVLKAVDNSSKSYDVIRVHNVSKVTISGGQIIGERYGHGSKEGEWGMGIGIYDSTNINVTGVNISDCWGDGIYIGSKHEEDPGAGSTTINITNCSIHNNRRNNLSIVCADYVTVDNCAFNGANGTAPEFGIDIEPNITRNPCEHIVISNSTFDGNAKGSMGIITSANDITISNCILNGDFVNYDGTDVIISGSTINGEMNARIGVSLVDGTVINDGGSEEDILIASFRAADGPYTLGEYGLDASDLVSYDWIEDSDSPSGKALRLERLTEGTKDAGYYLELSEMTEGDSSALKQGVTYRFEYVVKGSGQWGIKTNQTGWYPCVPMSDKFSTGIVTYKAKPAKSCKLMLYAVDTINGMELEIDSIKIYQVK